MAGQSLTLERNDAYWGTPGNADEIVFRLIADATAQPQALQNEEVQSHQRRSPTPTCSRSSRASTA